MESWNNLERPEIAAGHPDWFADVAAIAQFLRDLSEEFARDFIIGIADEENGVTEDLFDISAEPPDLAMLRRIIGTD